MARVSPPWEASILRHHRRRAVRVQSAAAGLIALLASAAAAAQVELPDIGDPVDRVLSRQQEAAIGARMMAQAREQLALNRDAEVAMYLDDLGQGLARVVPDPPPNGFTFFLVRDNRINAFAAPGGYIGINSGLFQAAETEAQLAGVLAHEIAHVTQRHLAKAVAANQRNQYKTLAAVLASIILAGQNPEAAEAAIATGQAAEAQRRINYTRANEYEADRIGLQILTRAGYDPRAMVGMFELLAANSSGDGAPEFLRTHPISSNRIAEAQSRAAQLHADGRRTDSLAFHLIKRRLQAVNTDDPERLARQWASEAPPDTGYRSPARVYGLALLALRTGAPRDALERLEPLRERSPKQLHYGLAAVRAYRDAGELDTAIARWRELDAQYPNAYASAAVGTAVLLRAGETKAAVEHMTDYIRRTDEPPAAAWRDLAEAAEADGRTMRSHEALAEYYSATDRFDRALRQLELAQEAAEPGSSDAKRLEARRDQVRELKRRRLSRNPMSER